MRPLKVSDDAENELLLSTESDSDAFDALLDFVEKHVTAENAVVYIEDEETSEILGLFFERACVVRARNEGDQVQEFHAPYEGDVLHVAAIFLKEGFAALSRLGYWFSDSDELLTELHRSEFEESPLRKTTAQELRRRLRILSLISGYAAAGEGDEAERSGFDTPVGDRVRAVFGSDGRGVLTVFDPASPHAEPAAVAHSHEMFDGIPADLLALAAEIAAEPVTGVVLFDGPAIITEGTFRRLAEVQTPVAELGIDRILGPLLELEEFSIAEVTAATGWWTEDRVRAGFVEDGQRSSWAPGPARRDAAEFEQFGRIARTFGQFDNQETHYVMFWEGGGTENPIRDQLLAISADLGFPSIGRPAHAGPQEVWIPVNSRLRVELSWASALLKELSRSGLAEGWYRWCDRDRDWSVDTETTFAEDSLRTENGAFAALSVEEFMDAYARAGATVTRGSTHYVNPGKRSFTVDVESGRVTARIQVELGRGTNFEDIVFSILTDGVEYRRPESLTALAAELMRLRREPVTHRDAPYPRPIISSRSHLEVSAAEIVAMLRTVAERWEAQASQPGEIRGDVQVFLEALGAKEGEPALERALAFMGGEASVEVFDDVDPVEKYLLMSDRGVEILLTNDEVNTIFLFTETSGSHREYRRSPDIVRGVVLYPEMDDIKRTLGTPVRETEHYLTYDTGNGYVQFDFPRGSLDLIVIMRSLTDGPAPAAEAPALAANAAAEPPTRPRNPYQGMLSAGAFPGQLGIFLGALGSASGSSEHQRLTELCGPEFEVREVNREGAEPGRDELYDRTGVLLRFEQDLLIGILIRLERPDQSVYPELDALINGFPLPATRDAVLARYGLPQEATQPGGPWGFDLYLVGGNRYLRFEYAGGRTSTIMMSLILPEDA